jgi:N-acetylglucosaminyldiphosphoundecaprenol N-acetyl-beta-D-mannosaminyltransferase
MRIRVLGVPLDTLNLEETCDLIFCKINEGSGGVQTSINTFKLDLFYKNAEIRNAIESSEICSPDGASIVIASRLLKYSQVIRVPGIDLFDALIRRCAKNGTKIFLLGSTDIVLHKVQLVLLSEHPQLKIAGIQNGFWLPNEIETINEKIRLSGAKICFIALPSPLKEVWAMNNKEKLNGIFLIGVGGTFEVIGGFIKRAPKWMQQIGMEWFYRLLNEPKRLFMRYLKSNTFFMQKLILEVILRRHL